MLDRLSGMNQGGQTWAVVCTVEPNREMSKKDQVAFILLTFDQQFQMANMYTSPTLYTYSAAYILHWYYVISRLLSLIGKVKIKFPIETRDILVLGICCGILSGWIINCLLTKPGKVVLDTSPVSGSSCLS